MYCEQKVHCITYNTIAMHSVNTVHSLICAEKMVTCQIKKTILNLIFYSILQSEDFQSNDLKEFQHQDVFAACAETLVLLCDTDWLFACSLLKNDVLIEFILQMICIYSLF